MTKPKPAKNNNHPEEDTDDLRKLATGPLPFSGRQFYKWCIILLDIAYGYWTAHILWYEDVVVGGHSRSYFVFGAYLEIALFQIFFIAIYYAGVFLSRLRHRK